MTLSLVENLLNNNGNISQFFMSKQLAFADRAASATRVTFLFALWSLDWDQSVISVL